MFDSLIQFDEQRLHGSDQRTTGRRKNLVFRGLKFIFDLLVSLVLLPVTVVIGGLLLVFNPMMNPGPLLYKQARMGKNCKPFDAIKFRSMLCVEEIERSSSCPVEHERITKLGGFLRRSRIDELPQIINVMLGQMSLIGPRPDYFPHAEEFIQSVPGYEERHVVRPGISGLAQTEVGYAVGPDETRRKVVADLHYINRTGYRMELWIAWRTIQTVFGQRGS